MPGQKNSNGSQPITPREREILELLAIGLSTKQVASRLMISHHTVRTHRKNVMSKLGTGSTLAAVVQMIIGGQIKGTKR